MEPVRWGYKSLAMTNNYDDVIVFVRVYVNTDKPSPSQAGCIRTKRNRVDSMECGKL
jgi:hypothetical protein